MKLDVYVIKVIVLFIYISQIYFHNSVSIDVKILKMKEVKVTATLDFSKLLLGSMFHVLRDATIFMTYCASSLARSRLQERSIVRATGFAVLGDRIAWPVERNCNTPALLARAPV